MMDSESNFIVYSLPGSKDFEILHQKDFRVSHIPPKIGEYIVVRPFERKSPPIFIAGERHYALANLTLNFTLKAANEVSCFGIDEFSLIVKEASTSCPDPYDKIVLSRATEVLCDTAKWGSWLQSWRMAFPNAFIYLLHTELYGTWMGATPELLIRSRKNYFETMALAGTVWESDEFTEKEINEHEAVVQEILSNLGTNINKSESREVNYGQIRHLQTDLNWFSEHTVREIAEKLHPTPAVCGRPREKALEFILKHENRPRELYTGYIGVINERELSNVFVNLRCMQLFRDRIRVHIGGGVNAQSNPLKEWEETERKMATMLNSLNLDD